MARPNSAQGRYERMIDTNSHCFAAESFVLNNRRLTTAWRKCEDGNWMAWWLLRTWFGMGSRKLRDLAPRRDGIWTGDGWTAAEKLQYARTLRATYFPTGNLRPTL